MQRNCWNLCLVLVALGLVLGTPASFAADAPAGAADLDFLELESDVCDLSPATDSADGPAAAPVLDAAGDRQWAACGYCSTGADCACYSQMYCGGGPAVCHRADGGICDCF